MTEEMATKRKPRIALMGEFSAGKSTLCNFLLGERALLEKVTATRVPPVWMTWGDADPVRVTHDRKEEPISLDDLENISLDETRYVGMQFQADILKKCDLLDLPGISDPNMSSDVWETMLEEVDAIVWCTHATQSWRQSEAGVWQMIPEDIRRKSLLLITKFDKIGSERDQQRILSRLNHEVGDGFGGIFPISLLKAMRAEKGDEDWVASGAEAFLNKLHEITDSFNEGAISTRPATPKTGGVSLEVGEIATENNNDAPVVAEIAIPAQSETSNPELAARTTQHDQHEAVGRIVPRRVKPAGMTRTRRPSGDAANRPVVDNFAFKNDADSSLRSALMEGSESERATAPD